jgi:Tfp pilus assembly protein PilN
MNGASDQPEEFDVQPEQGRREESQSGSDASAGSSSAAPHSRRVRRRMSAEHIRQIKRKRRRRKILIGVLVIIAVLAVFAGAFVWSALQAKNELQQAVSSAQGLQQTIVDSDKSKREEQVNTFSDHVSKAYKQTSSPLWQLASVVPYAGDDISAVRTMVAAMENISSQALPQLLQAADNIDLNNVHVENGTIEISGLEASQRPLQIADDTIDKATREVKTVKAVKTPHIAQVADALKTAETYCEKLDSVVHSLNSIVQVLPSMLGTESHANDAPRNYLILAQTNAEARPSGGLTGSLGLVTVQGGHVSLQPFVSDSEIQNADEPVVDLTAEERLLFTDKLGKDIRDVNFTPDFPRTGEIVSAMWNRQYGVAVDGVIAIDPLFLQNMLAVTGGVAMPDGSTLDGANTAQTLLHDVYARMVPQETDEYFAVAAQAAFDHIMQNAGNFKSYVKALSTSVEQGHVMVWSAHEGEQNLIADSAISGKLITEGAKPQVGVYISDETESKMDWYLHREVTTEFQKVARNGANQYTVHIKLQNTMTAEEAASEVEYVTGGGNIVPKGQIKTALFIYAPANGRLVDWEFQNADDYKGVTLHNGLTVGVGDVTLQPGESYEITVHVQSAPDTDEPLTLRQTPLIEGR